MTLPVAQKVHKAVYGARRGHGGGSTPADLIQNQQAACAGLLIDFLKRMVWPVDPLARGVLPDLTASKARRRVPPREEFSGHEGFPDRRLPNEREAVPGGVAKHGRREVFGCGFDPLGVGAL